jgi:hypothetical protein
MTAEDCESKCAQESGCRSSFVILDLDRTEASSGDCFRTGSNTSCVVSVRAELYGG